MREDRPAREFTFSDATPVPPTKTKRVLSPKAKRNAKNKAARAARRNNR